MFPFPLLMTLIMGAMVLVTIWLGTRFFMEVISWLFNGGRPRPLCDHVSKRRQIQRSQVLHSENDWNVYEQSSEYA